MSDRKIESKSIALNANGNPAASPWTTTVRLISALINVTGTPSAWVVTLQSANNANVGIAAPVIPYSKSFAAASTTPDVIANFDSQAGLEMPGGINIVLSGTTPGVANIDLTVQRMD